MSCASDEATMGSKINWVLVATVVALFVISVIGAVLALSRYDRGSVVELSLNQPRNPGGTVYLSDGVVIPGYYPFTADDTIADLIRKAGGPGEGANPSDLRLSLAASANASEVQRVDINRAGTWLLQALPGIGNTLAQRIVDFRTQNGPFLNTADLTKVSGIGKDTFGKIQDLITVDGD
jgi:competence protein ComEA